MAPSKKARANARARATKYRKDFPERVRASKRNAVLKKRYGITAAERDALFEAQGGRCAICYGDLKRLVVDHDHSLLEIRGLLCDGCNTFVGFLERGLLESALEYLINPASKRR
jgi:hypothetical protein